VTFVITKWFRKRPRTIYTKKHYRDHAEAARALAHERLEHFNRHYGLSYNKVSIKNTKTRWGSCSSKRNLNFNYKILFLSPEERDYIIVHELCHLKEMNHGPHFWALVAEQVPNWQTLRRTVKKGLR
jgi:predicted metal-dependent hydrolase